MASRWTAAVIVPAVATLISPAWARVESAPVVTDRTRATLVAMGDAVVPGTPVPIALRLQLKPGWHTYWRNPGDSGEPASVTLHVQGKDIKGPDVWPLPERIDAAGIISYGHHGDVALLTMLPASAAEAGSVMQIDAEATWLVCEKVCVPEKGRFVLRVPVAAGPASADARDSRKPTPPAIDTASFAKTGQSLTLRVPTAALGSADGRVVDAYFFPERGDQIDHSAPQALQSRDGEITLTMPVAQFSGPAVSALRGVLTITRERADGAPRTEAFELAAQPAAP
ncbi:MAG TPA: protein-disulfide reductase DsbD domain-containing protein [Vineibacter sp.]|nr:protein-disulfide reductase DsbD domain-containing protein [Vineibacter sp.]